MISIELSLFTATLIALFAVAKQRTHVLIFILSLEASSLTLALLYSLSFSFRSEDYSGIILLTFAAAETAVALALLTSLTRAQGSDSISACSFSIIIVRQ